MKFSRVLVISALLASFFSVCTTHSAYAGTPPSVTTPTFSVTPIPLTGSTETVSATVTPGSAPITGVQFYLYENGGYIDYNGHAGVNTPGTNVWTFAYNSSSTGQIGPNSTPKPIQWTVKAVATDSSNTTTTEISLPTIQPADTPAVVAIPSLSPNPVPLAGGPETVSVSVMPGAATITNVQSYLYENGDYYDYSGTAMTNTPGTNTWTSTYSSAVKANSSPNTESWTVKTTATDSCGNTVSATSTPDIQPADTPATITTPTFSTTPIPVTGSSETITVTVAPGASVVSGVQVYLFDNGSYIDYYGHAMTNTPGTNSWTYTYATSVGVNTSVNPADWTVKVIATDADGATVTSPYGSAVQAAYTDPTSGIPTLTPSTEPVTGGPSTLSVAITPGTGTISGVAGYLYEDGNLASYYYGLALTNTPGTNTWTYNFSSPNYQIPANTTGVHIWTVKTVATDSYAQTATATGGDTTQPAYSPMSIATPTLSVTPIPLTGGPETASVTVAPGSASVTGVLGYLYANGNLESYYYGSPMVNTPGTNTWSYNYASTNYQIPPNDGNVPIVWTFKAVATDSFGQSVTSATTNATQPATTPLNISTPTFSTLPIPVSGGPQTASVTITPAAAPISTVTVYLYEDGNVTYYYGNAMVNTPGTNTWTYNYTASNQIPANTGAAPHVWVLKVIATDTDNSSVTAFSASAIQPAPTQVTNTPPAVATPTFSLTPIPVGGTSETITATVTPGSLSISSVKAQLFEGTNAYQSPITLTMGANNTWSGAATIPANSSTNTIVWTAVVTATDSASETAVATSAADTQTNASGNPPSASAVTYLPSPIPVIPGSETISATVTPGSAALSSVYAYLFKDGAYYASAALTQQGTTSTYSGPFSQPNNADAVTHVWSALVIATDKSGQAAEALSAQNAQLADTPASFGTPTLTTLNLPITATTEVGTVTLTPSAAGVRSVTMFIYEDGVEYTYVTATNTSGTTWSGSFTVPLNTSLSTHTWSVSFTSYDESSDQVSSPFSAPATQASDSATTLGTPTLSVTNIPIAQSTEVATDTITPGAAGINYVHAYVYEDGQYETYYTATNTPGTSTWTASITIPTNASQLTHTWTVAFYEYDNSQIGTWSVLSAPSTQAADTTAALGVPTFSVTSVPISQTAEILTDTITPDAAGIKNVYAYVYEDGIEYTYYTATNTSGNTWTANFNIPASTNSTGHVWTTAFYENDNSNNSAWSAVSPVPAVQAAYSTASLGTPTLSVTPNIGVAGTAEITTDTLTPSSAGVSYVRAYVYEDGNEVTYYTATNTSGNTWTANFTIPANTIAASHVWTVAFYENDNNNANVTSALSSPATQAANLPASLAVPALSVTPNIPVGGGANIASDVITPSTAGVSSVTAYLYEDGSESSSLAATNNNGTWSATFNISSNPNPVAHTYYTYFVENDNSGVSVQSPNSVIATQSADQPASISEPTFSASPIPVGGVLETISTTVSAGTASISNVYGTVYRDGSTYTTVTLTAQSTPGLYSGTYTIPSSSDAVTHTWTVVAYATDADGVNVYSLPSADDVQAANTPPAIYNFTPTSGPVGTSVTITGLNFAGATNVAFDGTAATAVTIQDNDTILATVPLNALTGQITVTTSKGTGNTSADSPSVFTVTVPQNYTVVASSPTVSVNEGASVNTETISLTTTGGFSKNVTLSASNLPSGVTASFATNPVLYPNTSTLTLTAAPTATAGTTTITITGTDSADNLVNTTTIQLTVVPETIFTSMTITPATATVIVGTTTPFGTVERDQFGNVLASPVAPSWSVSGGGTIDSSGNFNATTIGGPYTITASAPSGTNTVTATAQATVVGVPSFTLSSTSTSLSVNQGGSNTSTISFNPLNNYNGNVSLSVTGLPNGVTYSFTNLVISGTQTSVLTLAAGPFATPGTVTIQVVGTDGATSAQVPITLTVVQAQVLTSITVSPNPASVISGQVLSFTAAGFDQNSNPMNPEPTFSWTTTGGGTIDANGNYTATTVGSYSVTATAGTGASEVYSPADPVTVETATNFLLSASPTSMSLNQGATKSTTIGLNNFGGFTGGVVLSYSGLPSGITGSFTPSTISGTQTSSLTFVVSSTMPAGTYPVTVTGTYGSGVGALVHSVTVTLTVSNYQVLTSIIVTPASATVVDGGTQTFTAKAYDQASTLLVTQPTFTWTVSGGGTITNGLFTANTTGGPFTATASSGGVNGTASVTVTAGPLITNAAITPSTLSSSGGKITVSANVIDLTSTISSVNAELILNGAGYQALTLATAGGGAPYTDTISIPANTNSTPDVFTASITAIDDQGYSNTINANGQCTEDSPPSTSITGGPANGSTICVNSATFTVTGTDAVTPTGSLLYQYSLDGGAFSTPSTSTVITLTALADGTHTLVVDAINGAGSIDPVGATVTFTVSVNPPVISAVAANPLDITATITWTTDKPTTSEVNFGSTTTYGYSTLLNPTDTTSHSVTISGLTATTNYHYQVVSGNSCSQSMSGDNTFTTLPTQLPNLEVTTLNAASSSIQGQPIQVSWTISNVGLGSTVGTWNDQLYLSTTPSYSSGAILVGTYANQSTLFAGQSYTETQQVTLPSTVYGTYYLILYTDQGQTIHESNYTDNANATAINISKEQQLIVTPSSLNTPLNIGVPANATLTLTSNSTTPLTGLTATVTGLPSNITATVNAPTSIAAGQSVTATVTVTASSAAVLSATPVIHFTDNQGDSTPAYMSLVVVNPQPSLSINPSSINTSVVLGTQSVYALTVTNIGAAAATGLTVSLPNVPWLSLATSSSIGTLAPGATATVNLLLTPGTTTTPTLYTGNLAINGNNAGASIGYSIDVVSNADGLVDVTSSDEYTYLTDTHPPVTGASITITNAQTGAVVLTGTTDDTGNFLSPSPGLPAGYYNIVVTSPGHANYNNSLVIQAGQTTNVSAFLSRNLVTYNWTVIPITTTDTYDITVTATFQTHVPAPVVTVSPALLNLNTLTFDSNGQAIVNYTITNNGLIAANNVTFTFPNQPTYDMVPAISNLGSLAAESSIVVPVTVYEVNPNSTPQAVGATPALSASPFDGGCPQGGNVQSTFSCGGNNDTQNAAADVSGGGGCGDGTPAPGDGGGSGGGGGGGGTGAPLNSDDNFATSDTQTTVVSVPANCDPCVQAELIAVGECLLGFVPGLPCVLNGGINGAECGYSVYTTGPSTAQKAATGAGCAYGLFNTAASCIGSLDPILNLIPCAIGIGTACLPDNPKTATPAAAGAAKAFTGAAPADGGADTDNQILNGLLNNVTTEANIATTEVQPLVDVFGGSQWFETAPSDIPLETALENLFLTDTSPTPGTYVPITPTEATALAALPLPKQLTETDITNLVNRWNNSLADYAAGIYSASQLPPAGDPNFIDLQKLSSDETAAQAAVQQDAANGYVGLTTGLQDTEEAVQAYLQNPTENSSGVCATVQIQLSQTVELTRTNFQATLDLNDAAANVPLSGISVNLHITNAAGADETSLFVISSPTSTVFGGSGTVDGNGTLLPGTTGTAQWTIIPERQAALTQNTTYYVGGTITYYQNGTQIQIPLFPTGITVMPDPYLQFHYFLNQTVYSQDPLDLPMIDPVEPFYLGLLVQNNGGGVAQNLTISSSQPQIVDNQKGLAIDFNIIGTNVDLQPYSPSLTVDLGNVPANGGTAAATFEMESSLAGSFIGINASFTNENPLGNSQTSLIDSVDTNFLNHIVQISPTATKPDFLTEQNVDNEATDTADTVWNGTTGDTSPVTPITDVPGGYTTNGTAAVDSQISNSNTVSHLTITPASGQALPTGYVFIRINDPGNGQYALQSVTRSDGEVIPVGTDTWTTKREQHPKGGPAYLETRFYIFDNNTTGSYTLNYYPVAPVLNSISPSSVPANSPGITLTANGQGFVSGASIVVNGLALTTSYVSSTQLTATIPASYFVTSSGTSLNISVVNPATGAPASGADILTVNQPIGKPVVSIATPIAHASFTAPASVTVIASATETGGSISEVDFYSNGTWIGKATGYPYSATFTSSSVGAYQLTAVATDTNNVTTTSSGVTVNVVASTTGVAALPTITSLSESSTLSGAASFNLIVNGTAYNSNSAVDWDGQEIPTAYISGNQLAATVPASFLAQTGTHQITVVNPSLTNGTSLPATFTVTAPKPIPPTVTITAPTANASYSAPASITLTATAAAYQEATVTSVAFYAGTILIGTATSSPYSVVFAAQAGSYSITAVVTDSNGSTTTSAAVPITVTTPAPVTATNVTASVSIAKGGESRVGRTTSFTQVVTVTNTGTTAISGPISLVLDNLTSGDTLSNAAGATASTTPSGSPYISVGTNIAVNASITFNLTFTDPSLGSVTYQARVLAGSGTR